MKTLAECIKDEEALWHSWGSPWDLPEADERQNNLSLAKIAAAFREWPEVWLGKVNLYDYVAGQLILVKYDGKIHTYNFEYSFMVPAFDQKLHDLILTRHLAAYTGTASDRPLVETIEARVKKLDGHHLFWS